MSKRGPKHDKTGRTISGDKFARLFLVTLRSPAWRALSPYAQRLYPWIVLEWRGAHDNDNGHISFSTRQASTALACNRETARRAFLDLQAKGFLVVTRCAVLGVVGKAQGYEYEITEFGTSATPIPRKLFRDWKPGHDFPVITAKANNPRGIGGAANLKPVLTGQGSKPRPVLTDGPTPYLHGKTNEAKNAHSRTYGVSHPYLPGRALAGGEPDDPDQKGKAAGSPPLTGGRS